LWVLRAAVAAAMDTAHPLTMVRIVIPPGALRRTSLPETPRMQRARRITLSEVASAAQVDTSTASRILNYDAGHRIKPATRERVLAIASELGYEPNPIARGLRTSRSFILGIAVPQLENPVFPQIILGSEAAARERGYSLLISHVDETTADARIYERLAQVSRIDGLLVATLQEESLLAASLKRAAIPFIVLNRRLRGVPYYVTFDNFAAARTATEHLLELGHQHIAHLAGHLRGYNGKRRLAGYRAALASAGVEPDPRFVVAAGYTFEGGAAAMRELLKNRLRPTGIVAATLLAAAGAIKVLHSEGIEIPWQMSVVAIHDAAIADMLNPPLTTVRLPLQEMGAAATRGLIDLIEGKTSSVAHTLPPEGLVLRASTAAPARRKSRSRVA